MSDKWGLDELIIYNVSAWIFYLSVQWFPHILLSLLREL